MTIDRFAHPALLVVDMQNDFVRVGAPLEVPEARATIPVHQTLLGACREWGIPVIYTKFVAGPEPILLWEWSPVHAPPVRLLEGRCALLPGRRQGARLLWDIIAELYPESGELIVEKFGYGAFYDTNLDDLLKEREVASVLVTGTVTQICVEETARESSKRGYRTTIISDAVSSYMPDLHAAVLKNFSVVGFSGGRGDRRVTATGVSYRLSAIGYRSLLVLT